MSDKRLITSIEELAISLIASDSSDTASINRRDRFLLITEINTGTNTQNAFLASKPNAIFVLPLDCETFHGMGYYW